VSATRERRELKKNVSFSKQVSKKLLRKDQKQWAGSEMKG
jgi:hypothetical protein